MTHNSIQITMKPAFFIIITIIISSLNTYSQLVTKRDYNVSFAIQAGATVNLFLPDEVSGINIQPGGGLKMTFPFNRQLFMGAEINYNRLSINKEQGSSEKNDYIKIKTDINQIQVPLYLKRMLRSNRASLLFGGYISWNYNTNQNKKGEMQPHAFPYEVDQWEAGALIGYEQNLAKGLDLTFKISGGARNIFKNNSTTDKKSYPLQAGVALSYRLLRLGGCKCD